MKPPLALLTIVLFSVGATACGGAGSASQGASDISATGSALATTASSTTLTQAHLPRDSDNDNDNPGNSRYDNDDNPVLYYGHTASTVERGAIAAFVKRYYAVAAAGDGATACSLIGSILAETLPEDYGRLPALHGKTCAVVVSKLFKSRHRQLAAAVASLQVTRVRVNGNHGLALLRFGTMHERRVLVRREHGVWKMDVLLDIGVP